MRVKLLMIGLAAIEIGEGIRSASYQAHVTVRMKMGAVFMKI
jgi:hypothetical protein